MHTVIQARSSSMFLARMDPGRGDADRDRDRNVLTEARTPCVRQGLYPHEVCVAGLIRDHFCRRLGTDDEQSLARHWISCLAAHPTVRQWISGSMGGDAKTMQSRRQKTGLPEQGRLSVRGWTRNCLPSANLRHAGRHICLTICIMLILVLPWQCGPTTDTHRLLASIGATQRQNMIPTAIAAPFPAIPLLDLLTLVGSGTLGAEAVHQVRTWANTRRHEHLLCTVSLHRNAFLITHGLTPGNSPSGSVYALLIQNYQDMRGKWKYEFTLLLPPLRELRNSELGRLNRTWAHIRQRVDE